MIHFLISKADISRYINIDAAQLKPVLKAALADFVKRAMKLWQWIA